MVNINGMTYELYVITMVDLVMGWFEQRQLHSPQNSNVCQQIIDSVCLSSYPRWKEIGFNNGSEFKAEFKDLCANMGLMKCLSNV